MYIYVYIYIYNIYTSSHIYVFCQIYYCNNFQFSKSAFLVISKPITYRLISFHRNTNYGRSKGSAIKSLNLQLFTLKAFNSLLSAFLST